MREAGGSVRRPRQLCWSNREVAIRAECVLDKLPACKIAPSSALYSRSSKLGAIRLYFCVIGAGWLPAGVPVPTSGATAWVRQVPNGGVLRATLTVVVVIVVLFRLRLWLWLLSLGLCSFGGGTYRWATSVSTASARTSQIRFRSSGWYAGTWRARPFPSLDEYRPRRTATAVISARERRLPTRKVRVASHFSTVRADGQVLTKGLVVTFAVGNNPP